MIHRIELRRGRTSTLNNLKRVLEKDELLCELPDDFTYEDTSELFGVKVKYKIGNGVDLYKDLPYEEGLIPVAFKVYLGGEK